MTYRNQVLLQPDQQDKRSQRSEWVRLGQELCLARYHERPADPLPVSTAPTGAALLTSG